MKSKSKYIITTDGNSVLRNTVICGVCGDLCYDGIGSHPLARTRACVAQMKRIKEEVNGNE